MTENERQQAHVFLAPAEPPAVMPYLVALPAGHESDLSRQWPLLLFLHGAGERGTDLARVRGYGPPRRVDQGWDTPFLVVSPQCADGERWQPDLLAALLDEIEATYRVDPAREYITGLSMGGFGAWALALECPDRFAAMIPICGGGDPATVSAISHLPVWAFHGARDDVVPLQRTLDMVEALRAAGGDVRVTVYPDADHDSWTDTYANPEVYTWLLAHQRRDGSG